jgi:hypothetical protein
VVIVLGVATTLAVIFWPGYRALDFQPLAAADPVRLAPAVPVTSGFADTAVLGNRAYFASVSDSGELGVVAADAASGKQLWTSTRAGTAPRWERMVALPSGLAVFTDADSSTGKVRMAILGAQKGDLLWARTIDSDDSVLFVADVAVLVDRAEHRLLFLEVNGEGKVRKEQADPKTDSGTSTAVVAVSTPADVSGPAGVLGVAAAPDPDDDPRIVQISADRSARVLNARTGDVVVPSRQSIADPDDDVVAHNGRLIVRESVETHRILGYDLETLADPRILYTALRRTNQLSNLTPCGDERVCWVETADYQAQSTEVVSVNAAEGGDAWRRAVARTDGLVPVGDWVLAAQSASPPTVALLNPDGRVAWTHTGVAARLDAGNVLLFSKGLNTSPDDPSLTGRHLGDGVQPLGPMSDVRSQTCSWNTSVLACVADEDFVLQRFTG